jgi:hypothetical protein
MPEQLKTERAVLTTEDALLSFGVMAALQNRSDALADLCAGAGDIQPGYPGRKILNIMASGESSEEELPPYVAVQIHHVTHHPDLTPDELFVAGMRFLQWAKKSNLQRVLAPAIESWARARWARAIEEQRFNLRSPASSVPAIRDALASTKSGLRFLGTTEDR